MIANQRKNAAALVHNRHAVMTGRADVAVVQTIASPRHRPVLESLRQHEQVEPGRVVLRRSDGAVRTDATSAHKRTYALCQSLGVKKRHRAGEARGGDGGASLEKLATIEVTGL